jgi:hypothetical protein
MIFIGTKPVLEIIRKKIDLKPVCRLAGGIKITHSFFILEREQPKGEIYSLFFAKTSHFFLICG